MESITNGIGSILGQAQNVFTLKTSPNTIDYSKMQNYSLGGVPVITYALIGITTIVLATITVYESTVKEGAPSDSMTSLLPSLPALPSFNPLSSSSPSSSPSSFPSLDKEPTKSDSSQGMSDLFGGPAAAAAPEPAAAAPGAAPGASLEKEPGPPATGGKKKKTIRRKRKIKNKNKTINNKNIDNTKLLKTKA
jgi:hypothetical protein